MSEDPMSEDDALWRRLVFPPGYRNPTPAARYHLTVIGAGPEGLVTAIAAAGLGAAGAPGGGPAPGGGGPDVGWVPPKTWPRAGPGGPPFSPAHHGGAGAGSSVA